MARFVIAAAAAASVLSSVTASSRACRSTGDSSETCHAAPLSAAPAMLQRKTQLQQRANVTAGGACCKSFAEWPEVDSGVTCDSCTALVHTAPYGGRCDRYCESFGHVCVSAAEEVADNCDVKFVGSCSAPIEHTSDMLCRCHKPDAQNCEAASETPELPPVAGGSIRVRGRQLLVGGKPVHLKGVAWNPVGKGHHHADFSAFAERDARLLAQAGVNAVRTYSAITDRAVLDTLWAHGIWVVNGVYQYGGDSPSVVIDKVNAVKDHPSILMWSIGNEWNYNGLYTGMGLWDAAARLQEVASVIKQHDNAHPVACIFGELHNLKAVDARMPGVDVWGVNAYRGISFGGLFDGYAGLVSKPLFLGEYGADAFNAKIGREDQQAQAKATAALTREIVSHSSLTGGVCIGGFVFELADEWWKDGEGSSRVHDIGGTAPGSGPYPDMTFNEEWWGLADIDRAQRAALRALSEIGTPAIATA